MSLSRIWGKIEKLLFYTNTFINAIKNKYNKRKNL